jgi:sugar (pentulose or hexulose) kinase
LIPVNDPSLAAPGDLPSRIRQLCHASGQIIPQSTGEIVRSSLESLALDYRFKHAQIAHFSQRSYNHIRVVGGGSQNDLLNQWTADACGLPVMAGPVEATALGNVMVQAIATGDIANLRQGREAIAASVTLKSYEPNNTEVWDEASERFEKLIF